METQEQHWERVKGAASQGLPYCSCLLDLRARVEALKAAQNLRQQDEDTERAWTPAPQTPEQVSAGLREAFRESQGTSNDRQIRSSLVERVAYALTGDSDGPINWKPEARSAIREVAEWMEHQQDIPTGVSADYFAAMLREEANR